MLLCSLEALTQHLLLSQGSCHVHSCVFLQCRSHGFFLLLFCCIMLQLSCRNVKNVRSQAVGLL